MVMKTKNPRIKRKIRIRKKIYGTATKPRLAVFKSNKNIYVQAIDDLGQSTIATASTLSIDLKNQNLTVEISKKVGEKLGEVVLPYFLQGLKSPFVLLRFVEVFEGLIFEVGFAVPTLYLCLINF